MPNGVEIYRCGLEFETDMSSLSVDLSFLKLALCTSLTSGKCLLETIFSDGKFSSPFVGRTFLISSQKQARNEVKIITRFFILMHVEVATASASLYRTKSL